MNKTYSYLFLFLTSCFVLFFQTLVFSNYKAWFCMLLSFLLVVLINKENHQAKLLKIFVIWHIIVLCIWLGRIYLIPYLLSIYQSEFLPVAYYINLVMYFYYAVNIFLYCIIAIFALFHFFKSFQKG